MTSDELRDHHDLVQLTIDYCWALDTRDWDSLRDVFVPDAIADLGDGGQRGIDEIIERVSTALSRFDVTQHLVGTHQIRIDGDAATGRCYLQAQHVTHGERDADASSHLMVGARYEDRFVRTPDGWRIGERRIVFMWMEANDGFARMPT